MDSSSPNDKLSSTGLDTEWKSINPGVELKKTVKAFYGRYLYSVKIFVLGAYLLRDWRTSKVSLEDLISHDEKHRDEENKTLSFSWSFRRNKLSVEQKNAIREMYSAFKFYESVSGTDFKIAVSDPFVTIYSNDQEMLYQIARRSPICYRESNLNTVYRPISDEHAKQLLNGNIYSSVDYKYKVYTVESHFEQEVKQSLLHILDTAEGIQVPKSLRTALSSNRSYVVSSYFFTNDERVCLLLRMVAPRFIRGIYPILSSP